MLKYHLTTLTLGAVLCCSFLLLINGRAYAQSSAVPSSNHTFDTLTEAEWKFVLASVSDDDMLKVGDTTYVLFNDTLYTNKGFMLYPGQPIYAGGGSGRDGVYRSLRQARGQVFVAAMLNGAFGQPAADANENAELVRDMLYNSPELTLRRVKIKGGGRKRYIELTLVKPHTGGEKFIANFLYSHATGELGLLPPVADAGSGGDASASASGPARPAYTKEQEDSIRSEDISGSEYSVSERDSVRQHRGVVVLDSLARVDSLRNAWFRSATDSLLAVYRLSVGDTLLALVGDTLISNKGFRIYKGMGLYAGSGSYQGYYRWIRFESKRKSPLWTSLGGELQESPFIFDRETVLEAQVVKQELEGKNKLMTVQKINNVDPGKKGHYFEVLALVGDGKEAYVYKVNIGAALASEEIGFRVED